MASFTERYHELTKYNPNTIDKLGEVHWEEQPVPFKTPKISDKIQLQGYFPQEEPYDLSKPFDDQPFHLKTLAFLLQYTAGITAKIATPSGEVLLRANPSAGGLYPNEIYVAVRETEEIPDGIYHYHPLHSALYPVKHPSHGDGLTRFTGLFPNPEKVQMARWIILITGLPSRSVWRYKERAYRRILLDTGHTLGNVLEIADAWKIPACPIGAFYDEAVIDYLGLDGEEYPIVAASLGAEIPLRAGLWTSGTPENTAKQVNPQDPMYRQQNFAERLMDSQAARPVISESIYHPEAIAAVEPILPLLQVRRSCREYSGEPIHKDQAQTLLDYAYRPMANVDWCFTGDHLKAFVCLLRVDGMPPGLYQYLPKIRTLDLKKDGYFEEECFQIGLGQNLVAAGAFLIFYAVDLPKLMEVYGDRGYRYACLDAGQIGERLNLMAEKLGLGSSGIGGYFDDLANKFLELPLNYGIIYISTVGMPG